MKTKIFPILSSVILIVIFFSSCQKEPVTIACVGNSITYGPRGNGENNSYPEQLQQILGEEYDVFNFGYSGRTLLKKGDFPYWDEVHLKAAKAIQPDIIIIKLGTNDTKPQNWQYGDEFEADYNALIEEFRSLASPPKIWLCYPVPVFETRWGIRDSVVVHGVIPTIDKISSELNIPVIDLYKPFLDKESLFPDKIHPDKEGCRIIAEILAEVIRGETK